MQKRTSRVILAAGGLAMLSAPTFGQLGAGTSNQRWDIRYVVERFFDASAGGGLASTETWETRWNGASWSSLSIISTTGTAASKQGIGRVDITYQGRVAIVGQNNSNPGNTSSPVSQRNYGVNRLGGTGVNFASGATSSTGFFLRFTDPSTYTAAGVTPHSINRGLTGEARDGSPILDVASNPNLRNEPAGYTGGNPISGMFAAFRVSFAPIGQTYAQGSNFDPNNGDFQNPASGLAPAVIAGLTGVRSVNFGGDGTTGILGAGTLDANNALTGGNWATYYKMTYSPKLDFSNVDSQVYRQVTVLQGTSSSTRPTYMYVRNTATIYSVANGPAYASQSFTFFVPTPGSAALLGLAGLAGLRRRR
jgi:uncharacterized protein (TIGR03382 family)